MDLSSIHPIEHEEETEGRRRRRGRTRDEDEGRKEKSNIRIFSSAFSSALGTFSAPN